jgi:hypothetical protein
VTILYRYVEEEGGERCGSGGTAVAVERKVGRRRGEINAALYGKGESKSCINGACGIITYGNVTKELKTTAEVVEQLYKEGSTMNNPYIIPGTPSCLILKCYRKAWTPHFENVTEALPALASGYGLSGQAVDAGAG